VSLERRNLQNLIRRFERSGDWPVDKHDRTLAQTIIDSDWMAQHDRDIRENEKRRLLQAGELPVAGIEDLTERIYQAQGFNDQTGEGMRDAIRAVLTGETA
jgi:hypothetical protein